MQHSSMEVQDCESGHRQPHEHQVAGEADIDSSSLTFVDSGAQLVHELGIHWLALICILRTESSKRFQDDL